MSIIIEVDRQNSGLTSEDASESDTIELEEETETINFPKFAAAKKNDLSQFINCLGEPNHSFSLEEKMSHISFESDFLAKQCLSFVGSDHEIYLECKNSNLTENSPNQSVNKPRIFSDNDNNNLSNLSNILMDKNSYKNNLQQGKPKFLLSL